MSSNFKFGGGAKLNRKVLMLQVRLVHAEEGGKRNWVAVLLRQCFWRQLELRASGSSEPCLMLDVLDVEHSYVKPVSACLSALLCLCVAADPV